MTNPNNTAWSEAEVLEGLDMLDKAELEGKPFLIVGVEFKPNNAGVSIAYIDGEYRDGTGFTFHDSSTGVRAQLVKFLASKSLDHIVESGEYAEIRLVAPAGLRCSHYTVDRPNPNGRGTVTIQGKTYYITTNGERKRATATAKPKVTPAARTGAK